MNILQGKSNQFLREAILEGSIDKARRYLTLKIGKAEVRATTEAGGFSMLHVAALMGNTQMVTMLLQFGADLMALTDDGYSALDLAIWRGNLQLAELLRSQGCIAPMKEPESLNGKVIEHMGRRATVVDFEQSTSLKTSSLRSLYYADGECKLVNLWAGTDYKIIGNDPNYEELKKYEYVYADALASSMEPHNYDEMLQGQAFFDNDSDSEDEDEIENVIEIKVPPGPLGVLLDSGVQEYAVVHGFTLLPSGEKGSIEKHGGVLPGMSIIGINETNASLMSLQDVTQLLGKLARKEKTIRFATFTPKKRQDLDTSEKASEDITSAPPAATGMLASQSSSISASCNSPVPPIPPAKVGFSFASIAYSVMRKTSPTSAIASPISVSSVVSPPGKEDVHRQ